MKSRVWLMMFAGVSLLLFTGCSDNSNQLGNGTQPEGNNQSTTQKSSSTQQSSSSAAASTDSTSKTAAKQLSLEEIIALYKKNKPNTDITGIEIDAQSNNLIYEVTGMDDNKEYKLYFTVAGDIQHQEEELLDEEERNENERNNEKLNLENLLSLDRINSIAQKEVSGNIVEWSLERDLSTTYWEITISKNGQQTSVSIDAQSGNVLEVETDD